VDVRREAEAEGYQERFNENGGGLSYGLHTLPEAQFELLNAAADCGIYVDQPPANTRKSIPGSFSQCGALCLKL
jgi:hypothetical protein